LRLRKEGVSRDNPALRSRKRHFVPGQSIEEALSMRNLLQRTPLFFTLLLTLSSVAAAQEWTRFRGPNGTGQSDATSIPTKLTESDYNWKVKLPGAAHSSPVLWGDKIFLLSADPEDATRHVVCLAAGDGKMIWTQSFKSKPFPKNPRNSFSSSTPAVDENRVYVAWATTDKTTLMALTHDGEIIWRRNLGPYVARHGFGTSPMLHDGKVILCCDQQGEKLEPGETPGESFIIAVDCKTGETVWRTERRSSSVAYSVPGVRRADDGSTELVCCSHSHGMFGLDPKTGRQRWAIDVFSMRSVSSPVVIDDLVFGSTGSGGGGNYVVAVRPDPKPKVAYKIDTSAPYVPMTVAAGELAFLWYDRGVVTCINLADGKVFYRERIGGTFYGSPVRAGNAIYCINSAGEVIVVAAEKEFKLLSKHPLGEQSHATPAIAGGRMYLRTVSHLICIGGEK